jgi:hypothetical protein
MKKGIINPTQIKKHYYIQRLDLVAGAGIEPATYGL